MGLSNSIPASILQPGVCTSSTRPAAPYTGQFIYETNTGKTYVWSGAAWVLMLASGQAPYQIVTSSTRPASPSAGQMIYETDTDRTLLYDPAPPTGWIIMSEPRQSHTMTVTSQTGTITTVGAKSFTYHRSDGDLIFDFDIAITTTGTAGGLLLFTLPIAFFGTYTHMGAAKEVNTTGKLGSVAGQVNPAPLTNLIGATGQYDNTYIGGTGYRIVGNGRYRMLTRYS